MPSVRTQIPAILAGYLVGFAKQPHMPVPIPPFWRDVWRVTRLVNMESHRRITRYWVVFDDGFVDAHAQLLGGD